MNMNNVSVKVKRRKSQVTGKQTPLCIQLICRRKMKRIPLDNKVYEEEWDSVREMVQIPPGTDRQRTEYLLQVSETVCETCRMIRQIIEEQPSNKDFSVDEIVKLYKERSASMYLSAYIKNWRIFSWRREKRPLPAITKAWGTVSSRLSERISG